MRGVVLEGQEQGRGSKVSDLTEGTFTEIQEEEQHELDAEQGRGEGREERGQRPWIWSWDSSRGEKAPFCYFRLERCRKLLIRHVTTIKLFYNTGLLLFFYIRIKGFYRLS